MFVYPTDPMPMNAPERCPLNGALWTSVWKANGLRAYEMISDTFWVFKGGRWTQY